MNGGRLLPALALALAARAAPAQPPAAAPTPPPRAGTLDTLTAWSQALGTTKRLLVYTPPGYAAAPRRRWPVLYYLHDAPGDETDWSARGRLPQVMDSLAAAGHGEAIVVMPDGDDGLWTTWHTLPDLAACRRDTTRPEPAATFCVPWPHYDDYVLHDVVRTVDARYRTRATREGRAIAGVGWGGFGAITLALRHPDRFVAAVSHAGMLMPRYVGPHPFAPPARLADTDRALGALVRRRPVPALAPVFGPDTLGWQRREPAWLLARARSRGRVPALLLECGTEDPRSDQSRAFRQTLADAGVSHAWVEWPGGRDPDGWRARTGVGAAWLLSRVGARTR